MTSQDSLRQSRGLAFLRRIKIPIKLRVVNSGRVHAIFWHVDSCNPTQRIQDRATEVIVLPVDVKMSAGETETSPAIRTIHGPQDNFLTSQRLLNVRLRAFRIDVGSVASFIGWFGHQNRSELDAVNFLRAFSIESFPEAHVEVPLIKNLERLHTVADRMIRERFELSILNRIAGPLMSIVAAKPFEEFFTAFVFRNFDTKVHAAKTHAASNQFLEKLQTVLRNNRMSTATV